MVANLKLYVTLGIFLGICVGGIAVLQSVQTDIAKPVHRALPPSLREVSGLAALSRSEILLHNDEEAVIYHFDVETHVVSRIMAFGDNSVKDDFEGIEIVNNDVYLVTSEGMLYKAQYAFVEGGRHTTAFEVFDTGLSDKCEVEGLVFDNDQLLLLCKDTMLDAYKNALTIFAWSLDNQETSMRLSLAYESHGNTGPLHPSAIEADDQNYYIVAGREHVLIVVAKNGGITERIVLPPAIHPQTEGIALLIDGSIVLADEGNEGTLTIYPSLGDLRSVGSAFTD